MISEKPCETPRYAPGAVLATESMRVFTTQIGFVHTAVITPVKHVSVAFLGRY